ncbi:MAG: VOC family protein [Acidobacteriota bacterium]
MKKFLILAVILFSWAPPAAAQLPDFYREVRRVTWVVDDLDRTLAGWRKLGLFNIEEHGEVELSESHYRGKPVFMRVRLAIGRFGDLRADWIQPLEGQNAYSDFLKEHGSGIFSLVHEVPSLQAMEAEQERLKQLGVDVLQSSVVDAGGNTIRVVFYDTLAQGKYSLGLIHSSSTILEDPSRPTQAPFDLRLSQFAFVIRDPEPVSAYWKKLGFPELSITQGSLRDRRYRGQAGQFGHKLGWQRHGKITYEWCIPLQGPTVYEDHLKAHGESFHHLGLSVKDFDKVVEEWARLGFPVSQSGAWGEEDKPGSGRFAYVDTDHIGGVTLELLWSYGAK